MSGDIGFGLYSLSKNTYPSDLDKYTRKRPFVLGDKVDQSRRVTVVMPTYCQSRYLRDAVNSVLTQTYKNIELIVVNDGSTDDTLDVLASIHDNRLRIVDKMHTGIGDTLNTGFELSTGAYETYLASDNVLYPECIERLVKVLNLYPMTDFVYTNFDLYDEDTRAKAAAAPTMNMHWDKQRFYLGYFVGIAFLWRRDVRPTAGRFWDNPCEDYEMFLRMADFADFRYLPSEPLAMNRNHASSLSNKLAKDKDDWSLRCKASAFDKTTKHPYAETFSQRIEKECIFV